MRLKETITLLPVLAVPVALKYFEVPVIQRGSSLRG
jgi:hypothetical protein